MLMKRSRLLAAIVAALVAPAGTASVARACTTFCFRDLAGGHVVFGRNYDFVIGDGLVLVNKRNVAKTSAVAGDRPASWVSKYGSVTFNQFGREFPTGGINEKGLTVELMWLDATRYPDPDVRGAVGVLEWIQYQLDNHATVAEILSHGEDIRIRGGAPLHYLVADATGACAAIEYLDGRLVRHTGASLPVPVLTNDAYEASVAYLGKHAGFGGDRPVAGGPGSLDRFARAALMVKERARARSTPAVEYGFRILDSASEGEATRWSIVYDLTAMVVSFRTSTQRAIRSFRLSAFDYSCATPPLMLDMRASLEGDVAGRFTVYSAQANLDLVAGSYARVPFLAHVPSDQVERAARHPEETRCLP